MTIAQEDGPPRRFASVLLPWLIAAGAVGLYLLTLNHWVTLSSLLPVAKISGWTWEPEVNQPLYWLVTYPFRWLPLKLVPVALNLFSAVCASLTLALLARSVTLLPHDRTQEQRLREKNLHALLSLRTAWVPPLLAALVCGLQLTFWENATAASSDMFDLLLFAYLARCLLEFRLDERPSWLFRAALLYGAGMANNWGMIGFLPVFLVALVRIKGLSFFNARFLTRMCLLGLAGLSLYLLLPVVNALFSPVQVSFWQALRANLANQKFFLFSVVFNTDALFHSDRPLWVLGLPSLLPVLVMAIRWPSYFGDPSKLGIALATLTFHCFHALLLGVCLWVALNPQISPHLYQPGLPAFGILMLPFYYLGALGIGYFSGYFLLVFGRRAAAPRHPRPLPVWLRWLNRTVTTAVCALLVLAPAALLYRNLAQVRATNGPMLRQYASLLAAGLPPQGAVVLSDDPRRSALLEAVLAPRNGQTNYMILDTTGLEHSPDYHRFLKRIYGPRWPSNPPRERKEGFDSVEMLRLVLSLSQSNSVYYLHPSFGYYFEAFWPEPHGLVYKLKTYPANSLFAPLPGRDIIRENEAFWARIEPSVLQPLAAAVNPPDLNPERGLGDWFLLKAHLKREPSGDARTLGALYSRALDAWAVELQTASQLGQAAAHFNQAVELNPDNVVARQNLECNRNLQAGRKLSLEASATIEDFFGKARNWSQVMNEYGPFDEPTCCLALGRMWLSKGVVRQAAQQLARARALMPDDLSIRLSLVQLYLISQRPDEALKLADEIHAQAGALGLTRTNAAALLSLETAAHLAASNLKGAESVVAAALAKYPNDESLLAVAAQVYMNFGAYSNAISGACSSNALAVLQRQLQLRPANSTALVNKGVVCMELHRYDQAIEPLTQALAVETNRASELHYLAIFYRALACFSGDKLTDARRDFEVLQKAFPTSPQFYASLGEIAYRQRDTNSAILYYQRYLANAPANTPDATNVLARLAELKRRPR